MPQISESANGRHPARVDLMGLPLDRVTEAEVIHRVLDALDRGAGGWIITANLDQLRQYQASPNLRPLFAGADIVVADGMPLVWASRLQRNPLPERIAGSEMIWSLSAEAALRDRSVYLLGDGPEARLLAEERLLRNYPGVCLAGGYSPPFGFERDPGEIDRIRARLLECRPDIVYVALGFPKQEWLIAQLREPLPSTWFIGVGISLSFLGGSVKRAPEWMIRAGLEWFHRLGQEPRRLARRYLVRGLPFALRLLTESYRARASAPPATVVTPTRPRVVFPRGALERERADALARLLEELDGGTPR